MRTPPASSPTSRLFADVITIVENAQRQIVRSVNTHMVTAYWLIGERLVEAEQGGKARARYGEQLLEKLSSQLRARFGTGYSVANLKNFRAFYLTYPDRRATIRYPAGSEFARSTAKGGALE